MKIIISSSSSKLIFKGTVLKIELSGRTKIIDVWSRTDKRKEPIKYLLANRDFEK